jgi:Protein of unknown function (DUF3383)
LISARGRFQVSVDDGKEIMSLNPNGAPPGYYYQAGATAYLIDPAGTYSLGGASAPTTDPEGTYSGQGASAPTVAAAGRYIPVAGATSSAAEIVDPAGTYSAAGASAPTIDPAGAYSSAGASAPTPAAAGTYILSAEASQYGLDRLFLDSNNLIPFNEVLSFSSEAAVANFFGVGSAEAALAVDFFSGYAGSSANMLFDRLPVGGGRARLFGGNISALTLAQLQAINGGLTLSSQGYDFSTSINLSGVASFSAAATAIQNALNANLPVGAVTTGSSIAPASTSFTASIYAGVMNVTAVSSGSIEVGGVVSGAGYIGHVVAQTSGTPGGVGTYSVWYGQSNETNFASKALTEAYGVLTIGTVTSGTVAVGEQVTDTTGDVSSLTAIGANLSGSGNGSTWVVETAQDVAPEAMTMTAAPLLVTYKPISGATANSASFWIEENGNFPDLASSITYAGGTAAALLGLTQSTGAYLSTPGQLATSLPAWMSNIVQNETDEFSSFQMTFSPGGSAAASLAAWAQSTGGQFQYLETSTTATPPIVPSSSAAEIVDPAGTYSSAGASAPTPAAAGTYIPVTGATSAAAEIVDPAGAYSAAGASAATIDPAGSYSLSGASAPTLAQPGYYVPTAGASSETTVSPGYYQPNSGATSELLALPPVISGTAAGQSTASGEPDTPFASVTIADPNIDASDSLSIQVSGAGGTLADGAGFTGLATSAPDVYALSGTAAAITSELDALVFTPSAGAGTTTLTLTDTTSVGTSASDATTTLTVLSTVTDVVSLATFLADQGTLDQTQGGFDIADTAADITANLDQLNDPNIDAIIVSDNGQVGASVAQLTSDAAAIGKLANQSGAAYQLAVTDTAADIAGGLNGLDGSNVVSITISDNNAVVASVAQLTSDAAAIGKLQNASGGAYQLAIADTASDVLAALATLEADVAHMASITATAGPVSVNLTTLSADQPTLDKIVGGFGVSDTAANVVANLSKLNADPHVAAITATSGSAKLSGGAVVNAPNFAETGSGTSLTVAEALGYAGAFSQGAGSKLSISSADSLSLTGTASLSGTTSGAGTLAIAGGSATINSGAAVSVANLSISGSGASVTLGETLAYAGAFSEAAGDTLALTGGPLVLTGAHDAFSGGTVDGSRWLVTKGSTAVSGLTIGGTVEWENTGTVNESGESAMIGDASGDEAILYNTPKATYDILDDSGIGLGASTASHIDNAGLFEKTGGAGASAIAPAVTNTGTIEVTGATLDVQGAVAGKGTDEISGASTLEFDSTVAAGQTVSFAGGGGALDLTAPQGFAGKISGFDTVGTNDTIEVASPWVFSGFTENAGGTQGTLGFANGASHHSLTLLGDYSPADFAPQTLANGSTLITYT